MDSVKLSSRVPQSSQNGATENFVDSYRTFTNVLNRLRRQYLDLKDESGRQARALAEANESLQALTRRNHAAMEFLNSVLSSVSTSIIVVDRGRTITHLNPAAETLFGVKAADMLGTSLEAVAPFAGSAESAERGSSTARGRSEGEASVSQLHGVERSFTGPDGQERTFLWGSSPLNDKNGDSFGSVEAFQDITDIKLMERKMTRMESLAAIGEMAATVAHQVRNPLVSVKGFASLICAQPAKGSKNKAHAEKILRGVDNLERVIDALLRFSRTESVTLRPTNLNRYLRKIVRQYNKRPELDEIVHGDVNFTAAQNKLVVDIDQLVFREAVLNIVRNAHEAADGPITCNIIVEECALGSEYACFEIRDDGPGMDPETTRNIFRPFFTTKASGSGLGLPLARKLINAHGGEIAVESTPGAGTTFRIKLPLSAVSGVDSEEPSTDNLELDS